MLTDTASKVCSGIRHSMSHPLISVIIPTFEEEKCVESILSQFPVSFRKHCDVELIISDGGSSDQTVLLARTRADVVLESATIQTIAMGRNAGARAATGDILMFFNADVRLDNPERLIETMLATFKDMSVVAATCNVMVNPEEETLSDKLFHGWFNRYCRFLNSIGVGMGRGECHVVRKTVFNQAGGYNEAIVAGEDFELFLRLRRFGKIAFVQSLTVFESPRRYRAYGYSRTGLLWFVNAVWVLLFKRSLSRRWTPIR